MKPARIKLLKVSIFTDLKEEIILVVAHIGYGCLLVNAFQVLPWFQ